MLWGGRFGKEPADVTLEFNSSENIELDKMLVPYDILGSIAHVKMLEQQKILTTEEAKHILASLRGIYKRWQAGSFELKKDFEDVHMNVEHEVTLATPAGKKMHTARSRNDQVLLDMRLYMRDEILKTISSMETLQASFAYISKKDGPMVGYTHTRVAQPITLSFWCQGWFSSLSRDMERLLDACKRVNQNPLGACAIAGTSWKIDRAYTTRVLGFDSLQENELDAISSRGECETELLAVLSILMCKLSRLAEELIWLSEKGLLSIPDEFATGSSIMPNKKNPDVLELVRGRTGRVYGNLNHCLVALKGLVSGYNSDMQETKFAVISGIETTKAALATMALVVKGLEFNRTKIEEELDGGFAQATEIADYLAMGGLPFREAHWRSGNMVKTCEKEGKTISMLSLAEAEKMLGVTLARQKWDELRSFERQRLKRTVSAPKPRAESEIKKIRKLYDSLLA